MVNLPIGCIARDASARSGGAKDQLALQARKLGLIDPRRPY